MNHLTLRTKGFSTVATVTCVLTAVLTATFASSATLANASSVRELETATPAPTPEAPVDAEPPQQPTPDPAPESPEPSEAAPGPASEEPEISAGVPPIQIAPPGALVTPLSVVSPELIVVADGTAQFDGNNDPGNDSGPSNGIVRTNDTVQYRLDYDYDGPTTDPYVTSTLPPGMEWLAAPPQCTGTGTVPNVTGVYDSVTGTAGGDRRVLICQRQTATAPGTESINPVAKVTTASLNGEVKEVTFDLGDADGTPPATSNSASVTVSAGAFYDLQKNSSGFSATNGPDGVAPGLYSLYTFGIVVSHPTRTGDQALKGITPLASPITFNDDLSGMTPNTRLMTWSTAELANVSGGCGDIGSSNLVPTSRVGIGGATTLNAVPNTGTITCSAGTPGGTFAVTLAGTDTRGITYPTQNGQGGALPLGVFYVATGQIVTWTPLSDITGNITLTNTYSGFDPTDVSGRPNFGDGTEPLANNSHSRAVAAGGVSRLKAYRDFETGAFPPSGSGNRTGDIRATIGSRFASTVQYSRQILPTTNLIVCDVFDNTSQRLTARTPAIGPARVIASTLVAGVDYVLEFGAPTSPPTTFAQMRAARCDDGDATWSTDPTDASLGGTITDDGYRSSIDRVRLRFLTDLDGNRGVTLNTYLRIFSLSALDPPNNPEGLLVSNFGFTRTGSPAVWAATTYNPVDHSGGMGDRITLVRGQVRVGKALAEQSPGSGSQVAPGSDAVFTLTPRVETVAGGDPGDPVRDVTITDVMPTTTPRLEVDPLSASRPAGVNVEFCDVCDGSDWTRLPESVSHGVRWQFGDVTPGTGLPALTFSARVPLDAPNATQYLNTAVASSPDDPSPVPLRSASATAQVIAGATVYASKSTATPYRPLAGPLEWALTVRNATSVAMNRLDAIDVLPHNGDGRLPASSFSGGFSAISVQGLPSSVKAYVTSASVDVLHEQDGEIDGYADPGSPGDDWYVEPGTGIWACQLEQIGEPGCPTAPAVTAVRFASLSASDEVIVAPNATITWQLTLVPSGNVVGDIYTNRFRVRVNPEVLSRAVTSPDAAIQVQAPTVTLAKQTCTAVEVALCDPTDDSLWGETHTVRHGGTGVFRLVVTNTGPVAGTVQVEDVLPDGLSFVPGSATATQGDVSGFAPAWNVGSLEPQQTETLTFRAVIPTPGTQTNTATATITDRYGQTSDAADSSDLSAAPTTVEFDKVIENAQFTSDGTGTITYVLTVTNTGAFEEPYTVRDQLGLPTGATVTGVAAENTEPGDVTVDPTWNGQDQPVVATATLPAGAAHRFRITVDVHVPGGLTPDLTNCFGAGGLRNLGTVQAGDVTVTDAACTNAPTGAVVLEKTGPVTVSPGGEITWTIALTNTGEIDAIDFAVDDTLPSDVEFQAASGNYERTGPAVRWTIDSLPAGESTEISVTGRVRDEAGTTLINCANYTAPAGWQTPLDRAVTTPDEPSCASTNVADAATTPPSGGGVVTDDRDLAETGGAGSVIVVIAGLLLVGLGLSALRRRRYPR